MIVLAVIASSYVVIGFLVASLRAWRIGVHRAIAHKGEREVRCDHFACDCMATELLVLLFLFWPAILPMILATAWFAKLIKGPSLQKLPPENAGPGRIMERHYDSR